MAGLAHGDLRELAAIGFGALVAYLPRHRGIAWPFATLTLLLLGPILAGQHPSLASGGAMLGLFAAMAVVLRVAQRVGRRGPFARPVLWLFGTLGVLAAAGSLPGVTLSAYEAIWAVTAAVAGFMWFICYAVVNATSRQPCSSGSHLGMMHPFWGSTNVPYGKGAAFVLKFQARTPEDLAVTQIKAVKLLLWADLVAFVQVCFVFFAHGWAGVPTLDEAVAAVAGGHPAGHGASLAAVPVAFLDNLLSITVLGHTFVAGCRYAGFRIPRNTYRPLEARSLAEFWNRYYYYFKELLVDFFFMPAFARLKGWPARARIAAATFFAAGVGNYLYHFFRDIDLVRTLGPVRAIEGSLTYAAYCLMLSAGICCSQLLTASGSSETGRRRSALAVAWVITFYCITNIFAYDGRSLTLWDHVRFTAYVIGMNV